jgi:Zn-dependent peptidase ImmA (M78 family)/transcriptional regulator with XRE-family HTH domain
MRSGTTRFIAARLKEARDARGVTTLIGLAGLLGVNTSSVSRWEDGKSAPTDEKVMELASKFNLRPSYFLRPPIDHGEAPVFFRSLASARKRDIGRQLARLRWFQEIAAIIHHYANLPPVVIPDALMRISYRQLRDEDIEQIAHDLRQAWKLGDQPISNVVDVLERAGFVVGADEMGTTALDGLCNWSMHDDRPYILLAKDKMSFFRRQMDAAHEMAHAILHRHVTADELKMDFDLIERQAFRLASAFLMPASSFALEARSPNLSTLVRLKDRWRVSIKAMIRRCSDLKIISSDAAVQLYKYYSAKGWSREEPLDRSVPVAKPRLLAQALGMIVDGGLRTKEELLANEFIISARDIEELLCLEEGWFAAQTGQVIALKSQGDRLKSVPFSNGEVLPFQRRN